MTTLYIVATPIGNPGDITARAVEILGSVDLVAAEDTRRTGKLLKHLSITTRMVQFHAHNEDRSAANLLGELEAGKTIALVSDAGTPLISDPGYPLVRRCREAGIDVVAVPGVSAVTTALSVAGIPTNRFAFEGFVPSKSAARREFYEKLASESRTLVLFEAPHRIRASLEALADVVGGERQVAVCRELTKTFEQVVSSSLEELLRQLESGDIPEKGEFVLVVAGADDSILTGLDSAETLLRELLRELPPSKAAAIAARVTGAARDDLYQRAMQLKSPGT